MINHFNELLRFKNRIEGRTITNVYYENVFFEDELPFENSLFHDVPYDIILEFDKSIFFKLTLENVFIEYEIGLTEIFAVANFPSSKINDSLWHNLLNIPIDSVSFLLENDKRENIYEDFLFGKKQNLQQIFFAGIKFSLKNGKHFYIYSAECTSDLGNEYYFSRPATVFTIFFDKEKDIKYINLPFF